MAAERLQGLLQRAAIGDAAARELAFAELSRLLMIFVRSGMGRQLRDHRESADVCQSIAKSFVDDFGAGKLSFDSEAAVMGYLRTVVQTKMAMLARHDGAIKRGGDAVVYSGQVDDHDRANAHDGADAVVQAEWVSRIASTLSPQEQDLARWRSAGDNWDLIAQRTGRDATTLRKQWSRLVERVRQMDVSRGSSQQ
ncbi:MAG: ECF-type sigma factor [Planctomycetota bacterium]